MSVAIAEKPQYVFGLTFGVLCIGFVLGIGIVLACKAWERSGPGITDSDHDVEQQEEQELECVKGFAEANPATAFRLDSDDDGECIICLNAFEDGVELRQPTVCEHIFHRERMCMDQWVSAQKTSSCCPICRRPVV